MAITLRRATVEDTPAWLALIQECLGLDYVSKQVYDPDWIAKQLGTPPGEETWLAEVNGQIRASISCLLPFAPNNNPVANVGRHLTVPENYQNGVAETLIGQINELCDQRKQMAIMRVLASDFPQQTLLEKLGYVCVGFQPCKHLCGVREGVLFYIRLSRPDVVTRLPRSQALTQINELASIVLENLGFANPEAVRDGATGYPLQTELEIGETIPADYEACRLQAMAEHPPLEVSGQFNRGLGWFRVICDTPLRFLLGRRGGRIVAGLTFYVDPHDLCVRVVDTFATDDHSAGAMVGQAIALAQEQLKAFYVEVDVLMTAPRLLKSLEQLGFVPVAYLPGFYDRKGQCADLVKMVKLNMVYSLDNVTFTPHAKKLVELVDRNFQDQKIGVAIINLLRALPVFAGLGDGELCKMARLFGQKLFRQGERVFNRGDSGSAAFVVMRGQIEILLEEGARPVATFGNGAIIGEQAFLDGAVRTAMAVAAQASILLVVQRQAFTELIENEPHLGMVIMRNIASELSNKLRRTSAALSSTKKA